MAIQDGQIWVGEMGCVLGTRVEGKNGWMNFLASCSNEGEQSSLNIAVHHDPNGVSLTLDHDQTNYEYCPSKGAPAIPTFSSAITSQRTQKVPSTVLKHIKSVGIVDSVSGFYIDAGGDGDKDLIVEASFVVEEGSNSTYLKHYLYRLEKKKYIYSQEIQAEGGILEVSASSGQLKIKESVLLDGDPTCCPTGSDMVTVDIK